MSIINCLELEMSIFRYLVDARKKEKEVHKLIKFAKDKIKGDTLKKEVSL